VGALKAAVGLEEAAALLRSYPYLVVGVHPSEATDRLDALAAAFRTDRKGVIGMCSRVKSAARLLSMHLGNTQQKVNVLCSILQLEPGELFSKCCTHTWVLHVAPGKMLTRAVALGEALGMGREQVARLCLQYPECLTVPPGTVVAAVGAVREALGVSREEAVQRCIQSNPAVLRRSASSITAKAEALKQHLGLRGGDLGKCMVRPHLGGLGGIPCVLQVVPCCTASLACHCSLPSELVTMREVEAPE
jgi:mTERF